MLLFSGDYTEQDWMFLPKVTDDELFSSVSDYLAKAWKYAGAERPANWLNATGRRDVFVYRFDWSEQPVILGRDMGKYVGAAHAFEIPFVFGQFTNRELFWFFLTKKNASGREELSHTMRSYWAEFARTGNPSAGWTSGRSSNMAKLDDGCRGRHDYVA